MSAVGRLEMALPTGGAPSLTKASASPRSRLAARSSQGEAAGSSARSPGAGRGPGHDSGGALACPVGLRDLSCVRADRPGHAPSWIALSLISGEEKGVASIRWTVAPVALVAGITVLAPAFLAALPRPTGPVAPAWAISPAGSAACRRLEWTASPSHRRSSPDVTWRVWATTPSSRSPIDRMHRVLRRPAQRFRPTHTRGKPPVGDTGGLPGEEVRRFSS